jgi:adenylate kinase
VNIILFGPPGAGKGTQADKIVKKFNLYTVSTGDLLRKEIKNNTQLGNEIKSLMDNGSLVSDEIIANLISKVISDKKFYNRLIFDGYPRTIEQAKSLNLSLKKYNQKISCVLSLNVEEKFILKRILGRQTCSECGMIFNKYFKPSTKQNHSCNPNFLKTRSDDNEETVINRLKEYLNKTLPILDFYKEQNLLHQINGIEEIDQIFEKIRGILASLET